MFQALGTCPALFLVSTVLLHHYVCFLSSRQARHHPSRSPQAAGCVSFIINLLCLSVSSPSSSSSAFLTLRSSSIRPGQFGYGRVPFSLPLHRQNRQARHTVNGTEDATVAPEQAAPEDITESNRGEEEEAERGERDRQEEENAEREISETPAAEKVPTVPTIRPLLRPSHTHTQHGRARGQVPPSRPLSRSSLPSVFSNRQRFDWSSVTAPPPPVPPLSRPYSPAAGSPFSPPLHRSSPVHRDRELHPAFSPQAPPAGSIYPLQHPHVSHLGMESGREGGAPRTYTCAGPEKEYRRCFSQVRPKDCVQIFPCESSTHN